MGTNQSRSKCRSGVNNNSSRKNTDSCYRGGGCDDDELFTAAGRRKKSIVLQRRDEFPERIRIAIDEARERRKSSKKPKIFLAQVQNALADWIFEAAGESGSGGGKDGFASRGLDDRRDTRRQVEIALRCFPEVLRQRRYGLFPIMWLSKSIRSASFIPLFAKLGVELGIFQDCDRGGLVFGANGMDVFSQLAASSCCRRRDVAEEDEDERRENRREGDDASHQREVDVLFLGVYEELRAMNLMKRSDIRAFKIMDILCRQKVFPERRFRYFVDWDPSVLLSDNNNNGGGGCDSSNKTVSIRLIKRFFDKKDISGLKMLFELAVRYYPVELGFLFDTMYSVDGEKKPSSFRKKKKRSSFEKKKKKKHHPGSKRRINVNDDMNRSDHTAMSLNSNNNNSDHSRTSIVPLFEHSTSLFEFACDVHGRETVEALVDSMLHDRMTKDPDFTRKALVRAAIGDEERGAAEIVYRLLRKDPTVLLLR